MKASDLFVQCLEEEGIEYIFGVPGEENADFMISLEQSTKIKFVLTRHEQGAAFMAEIYGRLTGNPAGALGTLGPRRPVHQRGDVGGDRHRKRPRGAARRLALGGPVVGDISTGTLRHHRIGMADNIETEHRVLLLAVVDRDFE